MRDLGIVPKKTFVLVPGAWLGAWAWRRVVRLLELGGNAVYPLTLTGMGDRVHLATQQVGIETAIQDVINAIVYEGLEDVVLVGHNFAGKVVAGVADRMPERIGTLLFLDAFRPARVRTPQGDFSSEGSANAQRRMEDSPHRRNPCKHRKRRRGEKSRMDAIQSHALAHEVCW